MSGLPFGKSLLYYRGPSREMNFIRTNFKLHLQLGRSFAFVAHAAQPATKPSLFNSSTGHTAGQSNAPVGPPRPIETRLLNLRVVRNMTKNGKLMRFSAMVAAGTGTGGLGVGQATHASAQDAIMKAGRIATKNIEYFERWQDRTLFHDDIVKFKASKIYVRPAPPNAGRRCHPAIAEMCRCLGIADVGAKVHGSRHPMNVAQGFLLALKRQRSPEQVAADSGMKIVDVLKVFEMASEKPTKIRK